MKIDDRSLANWLLIGAILMALLIYGRPLFVPLMFALMLWAVLNALVDFLRRFWVPGILAWPLAFGLIGASLYFVAVVLVNEAAAISAAAPAYAEKLQTIWATRIPFRDHIPSLDLVSLLKNDNVAGILGRTAASVGNLLLQMVLVLIYVGFLLAEQRHLPEKLAKLESGSTEAEGEMVVRQIGSQVQAYLGVCTFLSALVAAITYGLLTFLGVDFAGFWALVMFLLTYIPTVGGLGPILPALMALAQFGELGPALVILIVLGGIHLFLTNVVQTIMLGRSLNLSAFAIIISLTFWGLIWGIGGLFLAVPLTGAIAIACRHLEGLEWISEILAGPPPGQWHARLKLHVFKMRS